MAGSFPVGFTCVGSLDHPDDERCEITPADVEDLKKYFPKDAEFLEPNALMTSDCVYKEWIRFLEYPFLIGLTFPFPLSIARFFEVTSLAFTQLIPVGWRNLVTLERLSADSGLKVDLEELGFCYDLRAHGRKRFGLRVKTKANSLVTESTDKDRKWKNRFFYVKRSSLEGVESFNSFWMEEVSKLDELFPRRKDTLTVVEAICGLSPKKRRFICSASLADQGEVKEEKSSSKTLQVDQGMSSATPSQVSLGGVSNLIARFKKPKGEDTKSAIPKPESSQPKLVIGDIVAFKKRNADIVDLDASEPFEKKLVQKIQDTTNVLVSEVQLWRGKAEVSYQAKLDAEEKLLDVQRARDSKIAVMDGEIKKKEEEIRQLVMKVDEMNKLNREGMKALEERLTREAGKMVFEARIQMIEEYQAGKHKEWNLDDEQAALRGIKDEEAGEVSSKPQDVAAIEQVGDNQDTKEEDA